MSNLIKRLRLCERNGKRHVGELAGEAADEVERLTEQNHYLTVIGKDKSERIAELEVALTIANCAYPHDADGDCQECGWNKETANALEAKDARIAELERRDKLQAIVDAAMALSEKYWAEEVRSTYKELESLRIKIAALKEAK